MIFFGTKKLPQQIENRGLKLEITAEDLEKISAMVYGDIQKEKHIADEHILKIIRAFTEVCFISPKDKFKKATLTSTFVEM